jgi:hypothetical protein
VRRAGGARDRVCGRQAVSNRLSGVVPETCTTCGVRGRAWGRQVVSDTECAEQVVSETCAAMSETSVRRCQRQAGGVRDRVCGADGVRDTKVCRFSATLKQDPFPAPYL